MSRDFWVSDTAQYRSHRTLQKFWADKLHLLSGWKWKINLQILSKDWYEILPYIFILQYYTAHFNPQGTIFRESNQSYTAQNQYSHFCTQRMWYKIVRWLKRTHFCIEHLYQCAAYWYTVYWKQPTYLTKASMLLYRHYCLRIVCQ